jgi:hypothetical protein
MRWPWKKDVLPPPILWQSSYGEVRSSQTIFSQCIGCGLFVEFPSGTPITSIETKKRCDICNP